MKSFYESHKTPKTGVYVLLTFVWFRNALEVQLQNDILLFSKKSWFSTYETFFNLAEHGCFQSLECLCVVSMKKYVIKVVFARPFEFSLTKFVVFEENVNEFYDLETDTKSGLRSNGTKRKYRIRAIPV